MPLHISPCINYITLLVGGVVPVRNFSVVSLAGRRGTRKRIEVENSPIDYYWGCGADGSGENRLGAILMEVRQIWRA